MLDGVEKEALLVAKACETMPVRRQWACNQWLMQVGIVSGNTPSDQRFLGCAQSRHKVAIGPGNARKVVHTTRLALIKFVADSIKMKFGQGISR